MQIWDHRGIAQRVRREEGSGENLVGKQTKRNQAKVWAGEARRETGSLDDGN